MKSFNTSLNVNSSGWLKHQTKEIQGIFATESLRKHYPTRGKQSYLRHILVNAF